MLSQLLADRIQEYRLAAQSTLDDFTDEVVEAAKPEHYKKAITEHVVSALAYRKSVWVGISAAFFYTLLLIAGSLILKFAGYDLLSILQSISSLN